MPITQRSVVKVILFSIITCGIYMLYWMYVTAKELQTATGRSQFSPAIILVLAIFVAPVACVLLAMECNDRLNDIRAAKGMPPADNMVLWIVLGILLPIVQFALIQNEINQVA
ncbi:MAG: DUF4234 domain-containing protein [Clostridia bacterium]|nr:DUF4234 domain-containing protein [Clostridia bacterium]